MVKLLNVIEERTFQWLGGAKNDCKTVTTQAATDQNLADFDFTMLITIKLL